jgi:hypothetical protein
VQADATLPGQVDIYLAGTSGAVGGGAVTDVTTYLAQRTGLTNSVVVAAATNAPMTVAGTVNYYAAKTTLAAVQAAVAANLAAYINSLAIGPDGAGTVKVYYSEIIAAVGSAFGVRNYAAPTLNGGRPTWPSRSARSPRSPTASPSRRSNRDGSHSSRAGRATRPTCRQLVPTALQDAVGQAFVGALASGVDAAADRVAQSVKAKLSGLSPTDALAAIGAERIIERGPNESDAAYSARLQGAWDTWPWAGTPYGLLQALKGLGYPLTGVVIAQVRGGRLCSLDANGNLVVQTAAIRSGAPTLSRRPTARPTTRRSGRSSTCSS